MRRESLHQFQNLIHNHAGLAYSAHDTECLAQVLLQRTEALALETPEQYCQFLKYGGFESDREWKKLVALITVGESYFFRDGGQMALLEKEIFPDLIRRRQQGRRLNIWSAGCSTGEEPYSLAIILDRLLPLRENWKISITGTDINEEALEKARRGLYGEWSFRRLSSAMRNRYFQSRGENWELDERIRRQVVFQRANLARSSVPGEMGEMDLIVCRNVLIYFDAALIATLAGKFYGWLRRGGYLVTGHSELHAVKPDGLIQKHFPESVVYQREEDAPLFSRRQQSLLRKKKKTAFSVQQVQSKWHEKKEDPSFLSMARAHADLGEYRQAVLCCQKALEEDSEAVESYYLLSHIEHEQGRSDLAKHSLKKVLYLDPEFIAAYLDLGALYRVDGNEKRSLKMYHAALGLLKRLPDEAPVHHYETWTACALAKHTETMMSDSNLQR